MTSNWKTRDFSKEYPPDILRKQGLCAKLKDKTKWFYPKDGESYNKAMQLCANCPAREACAEWAIEHNEFGCWGATTDQDRKIIRSARLHRNRGIADFKHGQGKRSFRRHLQRGELPCEECIKGWAANYPPIPVNRRNTFKRFEDD